MAFVSRGESANAYSEFVHYRSLQSGRVPQEHLKGLERAGLQSAAPAGAVGPIRPNRPPRTPIPENADRSPAPASPTDGSGGDLEQIALPRSRRARLRAGRFQRGDHALRDRAHDAENDDPRRHNGRPCSPSSSSPPSIPWSRDSACREASRRRLAMGVRSSGSRKFFWSWRPPQRRYHWSAPSATRFASCPLLGRRERRRELLRIAQFGPTLTAVGTSASALPCRYHPSFTNTGPSGPSFSTPSTLARSMTIATPLRSGSDFCSRSGAFPNTRSRSASSVAIRARP